MTDDRSPHDEADDRLTRACAADGHPPADPDGIGPCACGEWVRRVYWAARRYSATDPREDTP